ncbi:hypothetical protein KPL74_07810 [Bacillus sp. NP157]|nr:hypothetical protein KPL74_07810 [Bacillus sp. NP157]
MNTDTLNRIAREAAGALFLRPFDSLRGLTMGYDVHITRKKDWFDEQGPEISLDEWKDYVASDPEMRLDGVAEATVGGGHVLRVEQDGLAVWTGFAGHGVNGNMAWFSPAAGGIVVKNPDVQILQKMFAVAQALGAQVVGDEGEQYGLDGDVIE